MFFIKKIKVPTMEEGLQTINSIKTNGHIWQRLKPAGVIL